MLMVRVRLCVNPKNLPIVGKKVKECGFTQNTLMVGLTRESKLFIPNGETEIKEDDKKKSLGLVVAFVALVVVGVGLFAFKKEVKNSNE